METLCDRIGVLHRGNLLACGSLDELLPEPKDPRMVLEAPAELSSELEGMGLVCQTEDDLMVLPAVPRHQVQDVFDMVRKCGGHVHELRRSRQTLEQFFVQTVRQREAEKQ